MSKSAGFASTLAREAQPARTLTFDSSIPVFTSWPNGKLKKLVEEHHIKSDSVVVLDPENRRRDRE